MDEKKPDVEFAKNLQSSGLVVLGRFQPFHRGHASMIESAENWRSRNQRNLPLLIAIGSSDQPESMRNPWDAEERRTMLEVWLEDQPFSAEILTIPDINDPPQWVRHAEKFHGEPGILFTTDKSLSELYESAGWPVILGDLEERGVFQGWRVRATAQMMSTVTENEAIREVLLPSIPSNVLSYMIENDYLKRLAFLGEGGEPVG